MRILPTICVCTMCVPGACGGKKEVLHPLELELQLGTTMWVLKTEPGSPAIATGTL